MPQDAQRMSQVGGQESGREGRESTPLTTRGVLRDAWQLYELLFGRSVATAAVVYLPVHLGLAAMGAATDEPTARGAVLAFSVLVYWVGDLLVQGALVHAVADVHEGRPPASALALYGRARRRLVPLLLASLVYGLALGVGFLAFLVPGLLVLARWSLLVPVVVLERRGVGDARRRSSALVRGQTRRVLATILVAFVLSWVMVGLIESFLAWLPAPVQWFGAFAASSLTVPYVAHVLAVLYFRLVEPERPVVAPREERWASIWEEEEGAAEPDLDLPR
jgi:hypothetical protein